MTHSISFITETIKDFSSSCNPSLLLIPVFSALLHLPLFPVFIIYSFSAGSLICFSLRSHRHILSLSLLALRWLLSSSVFLYPSFLCVSISFISSQSTESNKPSGFQKMITKLFGRCWFGLTCFP